MRNDRIWLRETGSPRYAEFLSVFSYAGGRAELKISADRQYAALINGSTPQTGSMRIRRTSAATISST